MSKPTLRSKYPWLLSAPDQEPTLTIYAGATIRSLVICLNGTPIMVTQLTLGANFSSGAKGLNVSFRLRPPNADHKHLMTISGQLMVSPPPAGPKRAGILSVIHGTLLIEAITQDLSAGDLWETAADPAETLTEIEADWAAYHARQEVTARQIDALPPLRLALEPEGWSGI